MEAILERNTHTTKTQRERADFHVHIGDRTNQEIIQEANEQNTVVLAALDRKVARTERIKSLQDEGTQHDITVIPGIEYATKMILNDREENVEFLGLMFDLDHYLIWKYFHPKSEYNQALHQEKLEHQTQFLQSEGYCLDETEDNTKQWNAILYEGHADTAYRLCKIAASHPANKQTVINLNGRIDRHITWRPQDGKDPVSKFLFWTFFAPDKPGYKNWSLSGEQVIEIIHKTYGAVIYPHPDFRHDYQVSDQTRLLKFLFESGVDGIEGWDADRLNSPVAKLAKQYNRLVLGGSGSDKTNYDNRTIGIGDSISQKMFIHPRRFDDLMRYRIENNLALD